MPDTPVLQSLAGVSALGLPSALSSRFLEPFVIATKVINVPVAKYHPLTGVTCGLKNWFGITGVRRIVLHEDVQRSIAELAALMRPTLTVVDATVGHGGHAELFARAIGVHGRLVALDVHDYVEKAGRIGNPQRLSTNRWAGSIQRLHCNLKTVSLFS
jgi:hypothetical protein